MYSSSTRVLVNPQPHSPSGAWNSKTIGETGVLSYSRAGHMSSVTTHKPENRLVLVRSWHTPRPADLSKKQNKAQTTWLLVLFNKLELFSEISDKQK